jgi:hypothetical protein
MNRQLTADRDAPSLLHAAMSDLAKCQQDHERYYASAPRERAAVLQRHAHCLLELAGRSSTSTPAEASISFGALKRDLWLIGDVAEENGAWLEAAMESSWEAATSLIALDELADVIGERHRIIANDWQAALLDGLVAKLLRRAGELLDSVELDPAESRYPTETTASASRLKSAAAIVGRAASLLDDAAELGADNEWRWALVQSHVRRLVGVRGVPTGS